MVDRKLDVLGKHMQELCKEVARQTEGLTYFELGAYYYGITDFKLAIRNYTEALRIFKDIGCRDLEGNVYCNLGVAYNRMGNFKQALECHKQHLSIAKEVGDRAAEGGAYGNLGIDYDSIGNFRQAIEYFKKQLSIAKEVGVRAHEGSAFSNLGVVYQKMGNFKQALECCKEYLSIAKEVGDRAKVGAAYGNLGGVYSEMGNFKEALEYNKEYLSIAKEVGDRDWEGGAYGSLGNNYDRMGNFKKAIDYHKQHLSIAKEVGNRASEGMAYCNLGRAFDTIGNFKLAIEYHNQDLSIAKEVGDRAGEGKAYGNLGNAYEGLRDFKKAIEYHKQRLNIAKEVGDRAGEGRACGSLGNACASLLDFRQAIQYYKQRLSIAREVGDRVGEGKAYCNLGLACFSKGELENAISFFKESLSIAKETGNLIEQGNACCALGSAHEFSGSICTALNYYRLSVKYFDETRRLLQSEDSWKISFRDTKQGAYTALWRALLKNGEVDEALHAAEQGRAQALTDILKVQYGVDEELSSEVTTKETVSALLECLPSQTVFTALEGNTISFWLLRKHSMMHFRQKEIENESAESLMKTTLKQISMGTVVQCENRSLDRQRDESPCLREAVQETSSSLRLSVNCLQPLYDVLVSPIEDLLQGVDLVFVPDGPFCLAPYSALSDSVRIRTVPSLTALKVITGAPDDFFCKSEALLVGDPCLEGVTYNGEPIKQLPWAKREVEMIGELLQTAPLTGRNATKNEVLKRMKSVALIHIAAHGNSEFGEIALAPNRERASQVPEKEDYLLTMSDVHALRLQARLVVLSCCHSGRGELKCEGVVGIARAFLCAGARSVLVSLWAIDDEATLLFMKCFYQHLADNKSASLSLHHAMKSLRETKKYSAIKYWAPFVLIGDDVTFEFGQHKLDKNGKCFSNIILITEK